MMIVLKASTATILFLLLLGKYRTVVLEDCLEASHSIQSNSFVTKAWPVFFSVDLELFFHSLLFLDR